MNKYSEQVEQSNTLLLRSLLNEMPAFCKDFFRGISNSTETRTQVAYCRDIYQFLKYIKENNPIYKNTEIKDFPFSLLEHLESADIDEYLEHLSLYESDGKVYKNDNASKARKLSSISKLYDFYIKRKHLKNNPIAAVERPKIRKKTIITLNQEQINKLITVVKNPVGMTEHQMRFHVRTSSRDLAIMLVFIGTGIRVSELVGLNINDIDFAENSLKILRKGNKEAFVYFNDTVASALSSYLGLDVDKKNNEITEKTSPRSLLLKDEKDTPALFLSLKGSRITVKSVENLVAKYAGLLGLNKKITPHKLRSSFGTIVYNETGDIYLTGELLGHSDINTTKNYYASMDNQRLKDAANIIDFK